MALKEVLASYLIEVKGIDGLDRADASSNRLTKGLRGLGAALAGVATIGAAKGIFSWVNDVADAADQTDKFATAIGASARDVAEWDMVLGNAGVQLEQGRAGLRTFAKQAGEANKGNEDLQKTFRKLGVRARDTDGKLRPLNDRLTDTVLGLTRITDPARRAAEAEKLFGEAGLGFVRVALDGAGALEAQRREFDELHGGGAYEQFIADSKEAARANDRWRNATQALRVVVAGALVPVLTALVVGISKAVRWISRMVAGTKIVRVTLATLAGVAAVFAIKMAVAFAPALLTVGAFVALIGGAVLLIEDIYQLFTGGESLIGKWIDSWLGAGEAQKIVEAIKEAIEDLLPVLEFAVENVEYFVAAFVAFKFAKWASGLRDLASGFSNVASSAGKASGAAGAFGKAAGGLAALGGGFIAGQAVGGAVVEAKRSEFERQKKVQKKALSEMARATEATNLLVDAGVVDEQGFLTPEFERELQSARASGADLSELQQAAVTALSGFEVAQKAKVRGGLGGIADTLAAPFRPEQTERRALVRRRGFGLGPLLERGGRGQGGGEGVSINAPTTINVQGAADPEETARRVLEVVDQRDQDNLRRVRDQLGAR